MSYLEGCTAPAYDSNQLHAAVVELSAGAGAEIKYSTVQNWYAGDAEGRGGIYNFVTKRGLCHGDNSKISWTQVGAVWLLVLTHTSSKQLTAAAISRFIWISLEEQYLGCRCRWHDSV